MEKESTAIAKELISMAWKDSGDTLRGNWSQREVSEESVFIFTSLNMFGDITTEN